MRTYIAIAIALLAAIALSFGSIQPASSQTDAYPWRGYIEVCELQNGRPACAYGQSHQLWDTERECMAAMAQIAQNMTRAQPHLFGRIACAQDREAFIA